jgi:hypothetical protein
MLSTVGLGNGVPAPSGLLLARGATDSPWPGIRLKLELTDVRTRAGSGVWRGLSEVAARSLPGLKARHHGPFTDVGWPVHRRIL